MTSPTVHTLESITAALERSEAQIAAGQTVPLEPVLARLRASVRRMETRRAEQSPHRPRWPSSGSCFPHLT